MIFLSFRRANQAHYQRKLQADAKGFRTDIERLEFLAVDWADEYEAALTRKDALGKTAIDMARRKGHMSVVAALQAAEERYVVHTFPVQSQAY